MTLQLGYAPGNNQLIRAEFQDLCRSVCSIQEASKRDDTAVWLGVSRDQEGQMGTRMLLSQAMAKDLIPILSTFVETGYLSSVVPKDTKLEKLESAPMVLKPYTPEGAETAASTTAPKSKKPAAKVKPKTVAKPKKVSAAKKKTSAKKPIEKKTSTVKPAKTAKTQDN